MGTDRRVALRLLWTLNDSSASIDEIARVASADPALTARVLAAANSPCHHRDCGTVATLPRAVQVLGSNTIRTFAATAALELFAPDGSEPPSDALWLHSLTTAIAAADVAPYVGVSSSEALTAGLLHDLGAALLQRRHPQRFEELVHASSATTIEKRMANERRIFGTDHARLGMELLAGMGLPKRIVDVARDHHGADCTAAPMTRCVQIGEAVAHVIDHVRSDSYADLILRLRASAINTSLAGVLVERVIAQRVAMLSFLATSPAARPRTR
ncbi:MAG: HDOD domain-containing protein [Acidimicrobiia bacterium]